MDRFGTVEFFAERSVCEDRIRLYGVLTNQQIRGLRSAALPMVFKDIEQQGAAVEPFLRLTREEAQHLMDELHRAGVRPSEQGSPGQLAAMQRHLDDMRALVFKRKPAA